MMLHRYIANHASQFVCLFLLIALTIMLFNIMMFLTSVNTLTSFESTHIVKVGKRRLYLMNAT